MTPEHLVIQPERLSVRCRKCDLKILGPVHTVRLDCYHAECCMACGGGK